jgi:hypothetical protein
MHCSTLSADLIPVLLHAAMNFCNQNMKTATGTPEVRLPRSLLPASFGVTVKNHRCHSERARRILDFPQLTKCRSFGYGLRMTLQHSPQARCDLRRCRRSECSLSVFMVGLILLLACSTAHADSERGKRIYSENCAPCHGVSGRGDGIGSQSLPVRPADHTNETVMRSRTDAFLRDVIANGGAAVGLSTFMPAWKGILQQGEIQDLVEYIRTLAQPAK